MTDTWLIVGLGNPGPEYSHNRHNVGQMVLDELASRVGGGFKSHKSRAQVLEGRLGIGGPRIVLAKPLSYMNVSGGPVSALAQFYGIDPAHVIAVHDEIDIPFDTVQAQDRRRRRRPQRTARHLQGPGHQGLPARAGGRRASAGPDGHRGLRPAGLFRRRRRRNCPSSSTQRPTPSKSWSGTACPPPSKSSTPAKSPRNAGRTRQPDCGGRAQAALSCMRIAGFLSKLSAFQL